jgi:hypothetical protein
MSTLSDVRGRPLALQNDGLDYIRLKAFIEDLTVQEPLLTAVVPLPVVGDLGAVIIDAAILEVLGTTNATLSSALHRLYIQWQSDLEIVYLKELIAFAVDYAGDVLATNPFLYLKLNEGSGANALDSSGNGYNSPYIGVTWDGQIPPTGGEAPFFDGVNDSVDIFDGGFGADFDMDEGCVLLWVKPNDAGSWNDQFRAQFRIRRDANNYIAMDSSGDDLRVRHRGSGLAERSITKSVTGITAWQSFIFSWSVIGNEIEMVVDGVSEGTAVCDATAGIGLSAGATALGASGPAPISPWNGYLAQFAIWDTPITPAILALGTV